MFWALVGADMNLVRNAADGQLLETLVNSQSVPWYIPDIRTDKTTPATTLLIYYWKIAR